MSTTKAIINLGNFEHNVRYMQSIAKKAEIYPVIKANAYGHGFIRVARKIADLKLKGVCIATINELEELTNLEDAEDAEDEEDTTPPIRVDESQDTRTLRRKIRRLMLRG